MLLYLDFEVILYPQQQLVQVAMRRDPEGTRYREYTEPEEEIFQSCDHM